MPSRRHAGMAIGAAGTTVALLLSGCSLELSAPPEPDLDRLESVWDMEVPPGTEVLEYYSSEVDFHGGRDDVYVLQLPVSGRSGMWDSATYVDGIPSDGAPAVDDIIESADAEIAHDELNPLRCAGPVRADQNYILACHDAGSDEHYLFEQIF